MQAKLPQLFGTLPKAPFEVTTVPDYLAKSSAPAYYEPGSPDGSGRGVYSSTPTMRRTAISIASNPSPTTKAFPAITSRSLSRKR